MKIVIAAAAIALLTAAPAFAQSKAGNGNSGNGNGNKTLTLIDGSTYATPGAMLHELRTRDNGYAAGNPKDIVNAYPDEFSNVGDLIQQKRDATGQ